MKHLEKYQNLIHRDFPNLIPSLSSNIRLLDNTLRDGEQTVSVVFSRQDKLILTRLLSESGVTDAEVGFPAVSEQERETIRAIVSMELPIRLHGLCRLIEKDVDYALESGLKNLTIFLPGSKEYLRSVLKIGREQAPDLIRKVVGHAINCGATVKFSCEHASKFPMAELLNFYRSAVEVGAKMISFPDTSGIMTPTAMKEAIQILRSEIKAEISVHCHNDLGLAVANTLAAAEAGAVELQACMNGLGERAGNAALEELALILVTQYAIDLGLDFKMLAETSAKVYMLSKLSPSFNKPVFGDHVFSHESAIHVLAVLKKEPIYEAFPPALIGREHKIVFGKHSGLVSLDHFLAVHGLEMEHGQKKLALSELKAAAESKQGFDVLSIIRRHGAKPLLRSE